MTAIHKLQTKHLNEHSTLYGGSLLEWIDNYCFAKTETYRTRSNQTFVTRHLDCEFLKPAFIGDIITLKITSERSALHH